MSSQSIYLYPKTSEDNYNSIKELEVRFVTIGKIKTRISKIGCVNIEIPTEQYTNRNKEFEECTNEIIENLKEYGIQKIIAHYVQKEINMEEFKSVLERKGIEVKPIDIEKIERETKKRNLMMIIKNSRGMPFEVIEN